MSEMVLVVQKTPTLVGRLKNILEKLRIMGTMMLRTRLGAMLENCIFCICPRYELLHGLGQRLSAIGCFPPFHAMATEQRTQLYVRHRKAL